MTARVDVLFLNPVSELSGSSVSLLRLCDGLRAMGLVVEVALAEDGWLADELAARGVSVQRVPHPRLWSRGGLGYQLRYLLALPGAIAAFARLCRRVRPRVVHLNTSVSPFALVGARLAGARVVQHFREPPSGHPLVYGGLSLLAALLARRIVCVSRFQAERLPFGGAKTTVVHNAFRPPERAGGPAFAKRILVVGRLSEDKGADTVLDAFARVQEAVPDARLDFVGEASIHHESFAARIRERISSHPALRERVTLHGRQTDMEPFYAGADLLLHLPRYQEVFGLIVAEAMARGLPCVVFRNGGMPEIVEDGASGYVVAQGDAAAAAGRCVEMLRSPELLERMGRAAKTRAEERFSAERETRDILTVYEQVRGR